MHSRRRFCGVIASRTRRTASFPSRVMSWASGLGVSVSGEDAPGRVLTVSPEGERVVIEIELRNHHPTDAISGLTAYLEAVLPNGNVITPLTPPKTFGIPSGGRRFGRLRTLIRAGIPPGIYHLLVTTEGPFPESTRLPIVKLP